MYNGENAIGELIRMAKLVSKIKELWSDRKRILGLPISFTRYALSEDRFFVRKGFLNVRQEEIILYRIRDLSASQTLWQRIFGVGSILITSTDKTTPQLLVKNVKQPFEVKELIHKSVEELKIKRRVRVGEMSMDVDDSYDFDELSE